MTASHPLLPAMAEAHDDPAPRPQLTTAIHVGASSVSMLVAESAEDGSIRPIDFLEQPAPLARDIFRFGRIQGDTTERIVEILEGFAQATLESGIELRSATRTVATNILVEASNHDVFLNRIRVACGLGINPIDDGEMTRLIFLKTRRRLKDTPAMKKGRTVVIHVGPGNTRALLFHKDSIVRYSNYRLGAHRTREAIEASGTSGRAMLRVIREHAAGNLAQLRYDYRDQAVTSVVAIGYEIQQVRRFLMRDERPCTIKSLRKLVEQAADMSDLDLVNHFRVDYQTAEALVPALETNLAIAEAFEVKEIHIPASDFEQGLLQDLLVSPRMIETFDQEVVRSAGVLASRYQTDPGHSEHVARISSHLFGRLADLHNMTAHDGVLLHVAALLHEVGTFISPRAHHKHSEYIILNSEIFGLDRRDVAMVALVARYHRHSGPRPDHAIYRELDTADRIRVAKLAAILRVADALERTHDQRVDEIELSIDRGTRRMLLRLPGISDAAVERLAMQSKGDLFEQVFGLQVIIDEAS